jgi:exodeoxyribonuclease VII small subunit
MAFEEHLRRLESIVGQLDSDSLEINAALALFEEGVDLLRRASEELGAAEAHAKILVEQADGVLETREFRG